MRIEYQFVNETEWIEYDELVGIVDPSSDFLIRVIDDSGDSDLGDSDFNVIATKYVRVCGSEYPAYIDFVVVDNGEEKKYRPYLVNIPSDVIDTIDWYANADDEGESDIDFGDSDLIDATDIDRVCVRAVVHFTCESCPDLELTISCYQFTGSKVDCENDLGLEMELEDGCWKPVRTGTAACCVQLDLILWKIKEDDVWSVLREPIETICGNTVWFKRVVTFTNGCENVAIEINSDES